MRGCIIRRSGEHTRLACGARRLAEHSETGAGGLGETPKPARETRALPRPSIQSQHCPGRTPSEVVPAET